MERALNEVMTMTVTRVPGEEDWARSSAMRTRAKTLTSEKIGEHGYILCD